MVLVDPVNPLNNPISKSFRIDEVFKAFKEIFAKVEIIYENGTRWEEIYFDSKDSLSKILGEEQI